VSTDVAFVADTFLILDLRFYLCLLADPVMKNEPQRRKGAKTKNSFVDLINN